MRRTRSIDSESPAGDGAFAARQRLPSTRIKANRDGEFMRIILACASEIASVDPSELVQSEMNQMEPTELLGRLDSFAGWRFPALRRFRPVRLSLSKPVDDRPSVRRSS